MKRHPSLISLSHDHHHALLLAQLLKRDAPAYKGLPSDVEGKINYAAEKFKQDIAEHFEEEESIISKTIGVSPELDTLSTEILNEHVQLRILFTSLSKDTTVDELDFLGKTLEAHIRKEERQWFPLLQQTCSEEMLKEIQQLISNPSAMKKDIESRSDVELLVNTFYDKVKEDDVIGYIFNDVVKVNWEKHLPVMYNFWENTIFYTGSYSGNPLLTHKHLHRVAPLNPEHFQRWIKLFTATVDELFEGNRAELARQRALSIATVMQIKILPQSSEEEFRS
jgi:hemoglobin